MTITIAPIRADMIETTIRVNAQPSSPAVSVMRRRKTRRISIKTDTRNEHCTKPDELAQHTNCVVKSDRRGGEGSCIRCNVLLWLCNFYDAPAIKMINFAKKSYEYETQTLKESKREIRIRKVFRLAVKKHITELNRTEPSRTYEESWVKSIRHHQTKRCSRWAGD